MRLTAPELCSTAMPRISDSGPKAQEDLCFYDESMAVSQLRCLYIICKVCRKIELRFYMTGTSRSLGGSQNHVSGVKAEIACTWQGWSSKRLGRQLPPKLPAQPAEVVGWP